MADGQEGSPGPVVTTRFWSAHGRNQRLYVKVDGVQIGHWDIGARTAVPAEPDHSRLVEQLETIETAALAWQARQQQKRDGNARTAVHGTDAVPVPAPGPATITQSTDKSTPHQAAASATASQPLDRGRDLSQNRAGDGVR